MSYQEAIEKGVVLLKLCQRLQSEKDGVDRPDPGVIDKSKTLDQFAMEIMESITYMTALYKFIPMSLQLAELGRLLEEQGKIKPDYGDDYSRLALDYVLSQYELTQPTSESVCTKN